MWRDRRVLAVAFLALASCVRPPEPLHAPGDRAPERAARVTSPPVVDPTRRTTPGRDDVVRVMSEVDAPLQRCARGEPYFAVHAHVVFGSTGEVLEVELFPPPVDPTLRDCLLSALRAMRLAPFGRQTFTITYPFGLGVRARRP